MHRMATNEVPQGPVMRRVVANVRRLRAERGWSLAQLSGVLESHGRPILTTGLHRLESGRRRVDVDDLTGLAAAFDVSPITLMLPWTAHGPAALTETIEVDAQVAWDWYRAIRPLSLPDHEADAVVEQVKFQSHAMPSGVRADHSPASAMYRRFEERPEQRPSRDAAAGIEVLYEGGGDGEHRETP